MLFCSEVYLYFFLVVFTAYWAIPWHRGRVWLLLVASFYFYACWNQWLALLIGVSTMIDYTLARGMDAPGWHRWRKGLLLVSIVGNLGLLCYFKYMNFFLESLNQSLHALGASTSLPLLQVILPVGISFYTFEAINYTVDVYRRKVPAERNLANFMLFITFFPHLVAGPIVRARDFLPQTHRPKKWNWARLNLGVQFFLMGLFKKLAIADRMACFVDPVFENPALYPSHALWMAMFAYALQVYGDFSGYTDMAIGSAHLLGYKLAQNFNMPYIARDIAEFWRRWHISLSLWLRDYLFIPLGGSRGTNWQTNRNLLITMTLGGLWHGASWVFVIWGIIQGLLLVIHRTFSAWAQTRPLLSRFLHSPLGTVWCVMVTFFIFCLTLMLFRSQSLSQAGLIFHNLFVFVPGTESSPVHVSGLLYTYLVVAVCHAVALLGYRRWLAFKMPAPLAGIAYAVVLCLTLLLTPASGKAFIYFQF
jgi:alginate O-acetyltransferase complex protein AlgI